MLAPPPDSCQTPTTGATGAERDACKPLFVNYCVRQFEKVKTRSPNETQTPNTAVYKLTPFLLSDRPKIPPKL